MNARELLALDRRELGELLRGGHAIDPRALDDSEYRGTSLGLPAPIVRLTWLTFRKTFHRDPRTQRLRGWNVRLEQHGLDGPSVPRTKKGVPECFGHYEVVEARGCGSPIPCDQGLLIDYGRGANARLDPVRRARDPIVALEAGSVQRLLGWTFLDLGVRRIATPSFFLLEREGPLSYVAPV